MREGTPGPGRQALGGPGAGAWPCRPVPTAWVCSSLSPQWPPDPLKGERCPSPSKHTLSGVNLLPRPPPPPQISSLQDRVLPWEMVGSAGLDPATRIISLERGGWGPQPEPTLTLRG